ncbi:uncharacterized protein [Gossypium hirsutum]|uniref:Uncharacterized protein isoform X1 n=1 Tax=Gossypium hirsutum TaxID=3635 RepID=A0ABM2ZB32_GOSHI|nr:uncharacterized protein LOC121211298 isoform X1 [Gossypium hirsutum]XP_040939905.1 uncharacterized protein LOC121211298 isoform X1 [Gossypium hirsutum]
MYSLFVPLLLTTHCLQFQPSRFPNPPLTEPLGHTQLPLQQIQLVCAHSGACIKVDFHIRLLRRSPTLSLHSSTSIPSCRYLFLAIHMAKNEQAITHIFVLRRCYRVKQSRKACSTFSALPVHLGQFADPTNLL